MIYAATHSLGAPSPAVEDAVRTAIDGWREDIVLGWDGGWLELSTAAGDGVGRALLGADAGQIVVADSVTVNLYKLASAALDARPGRSAIVVAADEFPTDRYVLEGLAACRGLTIRREVDDDTALVVRSLVDFRTSALADIDAVTAEAHAAGALMLWDVSHAVGIVPVALDASGADLAVGCTYKWLAAGPGAPAFLYVRRELQQELRQPIWGWFGQRDQFAMGRAYDPEPDIRRFQTGTPSILGLVAVGAAVGAVGDIDDVRTRSLALTERFMSVEGVVTPIARGGHVALRRRDADATVRALLDKGVVTDARGDLVRFGFDPRTTDASVVDAAREVLVGLGPH